MKPRKTHPGQPKCTSGKDASWATEMHFPLPKLSAEVHYLLYRELQCWHIYPCNVLPC